MARPRIRYKIENINEIRDDNRGNCVYKLFWGKGYVIVKAKHLYVSLKMMMKSLNQYAKGSEAQRKTTTLYYKWFNYITTHPNNRFRIEVLLTDNNAYRLLKAEQHYIKKGRKDKWCQNVRRGAYICKWNPEKGMYNWLPVNSVMNYNRYADKPYIEK